MKNSQIQKDGKLTYIGDNHPNIEKEEPMEIKSILEDDREIESIHFDDEKESIISTEFDYCDKIVAYPESGPYCNIAWIALVKNDVVIQKMPADRVRIVYK